MSSGTKALTWSIRRFPQKGALPLTVLLLCACFLVAMGSAFVTRPLDIHVDGEPGPALAPSVWIGGVTVVWAIAFVTGVALIGHYLRLHVAHGQTRRGFMSQATVYAVVLSGGLAALTTLGLVVEGALFRSYGWEYLQSELEYTTRSVSDLPGVFARLWLVFAMGVVAGMLVTAGLRRFGAGGVLLTIPLAVTMFVMVEDGPGTSHVLGPSFFWQDVAMWASVPSVLLGFAACWALTRKIAV